MIATFATFSGNSSEIYKNAITNLITDLLAYLTVRQLLAQE